MDCCGLPERNPHNWWTGGDRQVSCVSHERFIVNRSMVQGEQLVPFKDFEMFTFVWGKMANRRTS
jgi:acyl carrier protein phosphodiesterase